MDNLYWPIGFPPPTKKCALTPFSKTSRVDVVPQVFRKHCSSQRVSCLLHFLLGMTHNQPVSYHWQWITVVSVGANSSQVEIVQTLTQASWDNTYSLFFTFTSRSHLAPTLLTCHEKRSLSLRQAMILKEKVFCQSYLEAKLRFAHFSSGDHTLSWHSSVWLRGLQTIFTPAENLPLPHVQCHLS